MNSGYLLMNIKSYKYFYFTKTVESLNKGRLALKYLLNITRKVLTEPIESYNKL
jgi:hypothetical protein